MVRAEKAKALVRVFDPLRAYLYGFRCERFTLVQVVPLSLVIRTMFFPGVALLGVFSHLFSNGIPSSYGPSLRFKRSLFSSYVASARKVIAALPARTFGSLLIFALLLEHFGECRERGKRSAIAIGLVDFLLLFGADKVR